MTNNTFKQLTIKAILEYIEENIEVKSINIDSIVCFSGYSRRYLQSLFKSHMGIPLGRYIQLRRVSRAAVLLRLTTLTIANISGMLCYDSQQTFTREFKKNTGYTPLQYRNSNIWTFKNLTGPKHVAMKMPMPEICYFEEKAFSGISLSYEEDIPFFGRNSEKKWSYIRKHLADNKNSSIKVSHEVHPSTRKKAKIKLIFWATKEKQFQTRGLLMAGTYAKFKFQGSIRNYIQYINYVYMCVLPFLGVQKRNTHDLEIIYKDTNGDYYFEYYLPMLDTQDNYK
ncbi:helix-turn-helix domain-containing protein [Escherichia coli]|uniref:helix-turn-helix domain-containing protein n=1 Tax=Escherichia coli TaxID=562 RepID=UPI000B7F099A|nr:helix-turn-helix domain-containing protein [Escherichia coli]